MKPPSPANDNACRPATAFLLMAQYNAKAVIPINDVCRDYFSQFTPTKFVEKVRAGEIGLPLVRLGTGQKAAKGIALNALAAYLDNQIQAAEHDMKELMRV